MKLLHDLNHLKPSMAVSSRDTMVADGAEEEYFALGRRALDLVLFSAELCDKPHYPNILDFACGHGRVMRWLRAQYDYANITACDIDADAVEFCDAEFGAKTVVSQTDLRALPLENQFDLIWCGSLLTHLPTDAWITALDCMVRWTKECGVIVCSTQGRFLSTLLARGHGEFTENIDRAALLRDLAQTGAAYQPYLEDPTKSYGLSVVSPEFLLRVLQRYPNIIVRGYLEQAWGVQDVVILYKSAGYFETLTS